MNNRDYFTKPIQGGSREGYDYGNTRLSRPEGEPPLWLAVGLLAIMAVVITLLVAAV